MLTDLLNFQFDPLLAVEYAALVILLAFLDRRARSTRAKAAVYVLSVVLVAIFLLLFAPR